ncbi:DUF6163 family protein [Candidatus Liberibacter sp.]|uniref:DUF6163 family protein n=1 Tax=Candidatus Liberibacter sp. TaxID=34022 RepID=UPI0015F74289|nr:DUF6163 family protein [Candidatus Liberibacter sp.]MBA5723600.1 hypothetical protein [Candidatus Liberibacter sp.]
MMNISIFSYATIILVPFIRFTAIIAFSFTVYYWGMATGCFFEGRYSFDLLPVPWKVVISSFSVLFPVATVGLWLGASWGIVVWGITVFMQFFMYLGFSSIFGPNRMLCIMHVFIILIYITIRSLIMYYKNTQKIILGCNVEH